MPNRIFVGYASSPPVVGETIERAVKIAVEPPYSDLNISTWKRDDLGGSTVIAPIIDEIRKADVMVGDVTTLNFNVTYEMGYAVGLGKRVLPVRNRGVTSDAADILLVGIFDTLLNQPYASSEELAAMCREAQPGRRLATDFPYDPLPLFTLLPAIKSDQVSHLVSRSRKAGLRSRTFDPAEQTRLGAEEAIRAIATSYGIILPLLGPEMEGAKVHNIRIAFAAGLAHALERPTLLLQHGDWAVPLDIRDAVTRYQSESHFATAFQDFASRVHDARFASPTIAVPTYNFLASLNLGDPTAENEESQLEEYFLPRDEYRQVVSGRANIVVGRKGSGKTAVFVRAADELKRSRSNVVVDLNPESHQLRKLKDLVLDCLAEGSKAYLLTAFWEYVLLLEICSKMLDKDREVHKRDHTLFDAYQRLSAAFVRETAMEGVDFSDRLNRLIDGISDRYVKAFGVESQVSLAEGQLTSLLYSTTLASLRQEVEAYASHKASVFVLFDNLDKAWNASGLEPADVIIIRTLLDASHKLERTFRNRQITFRCVVFLRNDVHELLVSSTSDRGKETKVLVDWMLPDLLKQLVRMRLLFNSADKSLDVDALWSKVCVPLIGGESTLNYLVNRCLMRPRYLLRLINHCKGIATNFQRGRIDEDDILAGESVYSTDVVTDIDLEIRDVLPSAADVLYSFIGESREMPKSKIDKLIEAKVPKSARAAVSALLLWHGVLGYKRPSHEATFIYDVNYDIKRMLGAIDKLGGDPIFVVNPAFWLGLELT